MLLLWDEILSERTQRVYAPPSDVIWLLAEILLEHSRIQLRREVHEGECFLVEVHLRWMFSDLLLSTFFLAHPKSYNGALLIVWNKDAN